MSRKDVKVTNGGSFLLDPIGSVVIGTPEDFTEEEKMFGQTAEDFINKEVLPQIEEIDHQKEGLMESLLKKAGELGLLSIDVPEAYGGLGQTKTASMYVAEKLAPSGSFGVALMAHVGIGTLPIVFFGNEEQKKKYLPALASGEKLAAYALTETGSGSDALAAKTKAVLTPDGKYYVLNGSKQFITNAGFADVFVVFAKIDGEKFTGFIVEKGTPGFSLGAEEKKLGIKGSSTRALIFEDCKIPAENLLGEIGKGHKIAFNILNVGRFKLGSAALGSAKRCLIEAVKYGNQRVQFGQPITRFGMVARKIADMTAYIYSCESMVYRVAALMDARMESIDKNAPDAAIKMMEAIEEYAIEDSIIKIYGSECYDYCADEGLQIFGGYGYTQEYPLERLYRDSRINRIFEGTNEINRLVTTTTLLKRVTKGAIPFMDAAKNVGKEAESGNLQIDIPKGPLAWAAETAERIKKATVFVSNAVIGKYMATLANEQEAIEMIADMIIHSFAADSTVARTLQLVKSIGEEKAKYAIFACNLAVQLAADQTFLLATQLLSSAYDGDKLKSLNKALHNFRVADRLNLIQAKREVAKRIIEREAYELF